jgi:hypothetical protein
LDNEKMKHKTFLLFTGLLALIVAVLAASIRFDAVASAPVGWDATATAQACINLVEPTYVPYADLPYCFDFSVCGSQTVSCMTKERAQRFGLIDPDPTQPPAYPGPNPGEAMPTYPAYPGVEDIWRAPEIEPVATATPLVMAIPKPSNRRGQK